MIYILWFLCTIFNIRYRFSMILHWNTMNKMMRSIYIIVEITQRYWQTTSIWKLFYVFVAVKNKQLLRMSNSLLQHHLSISYIYTMCSVYISPLSYKLPFPCWKKNGNIEGKQNKELSRWINCSWFTAEQKRRCLLEPRGKGGGDQVAVHVTGRGTQGRGGRGECQPFSSTALIYNVVHAIAPSITSFDDPCISCLFFSNYHTRGELYAVCNFHWLVLCLPWVQVLGYPTCTVQTLRIYLAYTLNVRVHYENFLATMTSLITSTAR